MKFDLISIQVIYPAAIIILVTIEKNHFERQFNNEPAIHPLQPIEIQRFTTVDVDREIPDNVSSNGNVPSIKLGDHIYGHDAIELKEDDNRASFVTA